MGFLLFLLSLFIVAFGQPAKVGWLGALSGTIGFALFFVTLSPSFSRLRRFLYGCVWFGCVQLIQLSWMTSIEFQGYYILVVYLLLAAAMGGQFGLCTLFVPVREKISLRQMLFCASAWTLMEWVRLFFLCGFSWNPVGLSLTHLSYSLQFASVFGVFGLSFWAMLTNLAGVNALRLRKPGAIAAWGTFAAFPLVFGLIHFSYHLPKSQKSSREIAAALIETNLLPSQKSPHVGRIDDFIPPFIQWEWILKQLKEARAAKWDMIVLPEAFVPFQSDKNVYPLEAVAALLVSELGAFAQKKFPPLAYPYAHQRIVEGKKVTFVSNLFWCQTLANVFNAEFIIGLDHTDRERKKNFNSIFYLKPHSAYVDRYDKQVLLPCAEYLPVNILRGLTKSYGIVEFFSPGSSAKVFGEKYLFSPSICYEETFSGVMRVGKKLGAHLFVNVTNDNYFPNSSLHEQHLFHSRLRAVENGIPLIRACNGGGSAFIDSFGAIIKRNSTPKAGVLSGSMNMYAYSTFYSYWGDAGIIVACLVCCLVFWRREEVPS